MEVCANTRLDGLISIQEAARLFEIVREVVFVVVQSRLLFIIALEVLLVIDNRFVIFVRRVSVFRKCVLDHIVVTVYVQLFQLRFTVDFLFYAVLLERNHIVEPVGFRRANDGLICALLSKHLID